MIRIIHFTKSKPDDCEGVYVTQDTDFDAYDLCGKNGKIVSDKSYDIVLDSLFPTDKELIAE